MRRVWMEQDEDSGRYVLCIKGYLFTKRLPYPANALLRSRRLIDSIRSWDGLTELTSEFDNGDHYKIRPPAWAKDLIADALERALDELEAQLAGSVILFPGPRRSAA